MKALVKNLLAAAALVFAAGTAQADYPEKAVTIVAPYAAGGASDLAARALAETARKYLDDQPVVVVNQPGNGGMNGARAVSEGTPDGYTLLLARVGMALYPAVQESSPVAWDGYTFLGSLEATPMILAVSENSPYKTAAELVEGLKANPGALTYGASGATAIDGFTVQALLADAGLDPLTAATLVPYKGGGELATALLGGHIDFLAIAAGSLMPHIQSGKMRALMVYAPSRMDTLPDVPTAAELGYEKAGQVTGWSALYGPKNLPQDVVARWQDVLGKVAEDEAWLEFAKRRGSISTAGKEDMAAYAKAQYELFNGLARDFGYIK
ncbi:tripartite tricarboxylate transporter substrate binding protein [Nitratireductor sp. ZSWI3]|uniref:Bug family tripartite tricarboxylate transporter substrate binding protein n=1 Tax=Nitratireductor sp. ZSWI3 TaxID=2966359 RepID=UPI00214FF56D|nr:tripartite tricarboxylate transporter substrate binding protein [Nitratireductor sp. ZSWI3]MCR4265398.1 tripartite tricarboxylate transporter substrate binding protein [Nitratireductor sp. ZSWI3]